MNRSRLLFIGFVALALGAFVAFVVYKNLLSQSASKNEPGVEVVLATNFTNEGEGGRDRVAVELSAEQMAYAASDVLHLHALRERLDVMLAREGREQLAEACFRFLPDRVRLDLAGFAGEG